MRRVFHSKRQHVPPPIGGRNYHHRVVHDTASRCPQKVTNDIKLRIATAATKTTAERVIQALA